MKSAVIILILGAVACTPTGRVSYTDDPMIMDGKADDWAEGFDRTEFGELVFALAMDQYFAYVLVEGTGEKTRRMMFDSGLTLWLNPDGRKTKTIGIRYPVIDRVKPDLTPVHTRYFRVPKPGLDDFGLKGVISNQMLVVQKSRLQLDLDVVVGLDSLSQHLVYEFKIPLKFLEMKSKKGLERLAVGFEVEDRGHGIGPMLVPGYRRTDKIDFWHIATIE